MQGPVWTLWPSGRLFLNVCVLRSLCDSCLSLLCLCFFHAVSEPCHQTYCTMLNYCYTFLKVHKIYWTPSNYLALINTVLLPSSEWGASAGGGYQNCSSQQVWYFVTAMQCFPVSRNNREQTVFSWSLSRRRCMHFPSTPFTKQQFFGLDQNPPK